MLYIVLGIITTLFAVVGVAWFAFGIRRMVQTVRLGRPAESGRTGPFGRRLTTTLIEVLGHNRMLKRPWVGVAHWFVMVSFPLLVFTVAEAHGEVWNPHFHLPVIHDWTVYGLFIELISAVGLIAIVALAA